jgi:hypothetical protein
VAVVEVSVALAVVGTTMIVVATTVVGGRWSGIGRMRLKPPPTLPGLLALEIIGRRLREIQSCVARRRTPLLVVLGSPLVTNP